MENFELWPFQAQAVDKCRLKFKQGKKKIILCSPTGSGKTVMACWFVRQALAKGKTVAILVDRQEILKQFDAALNRFGLWPELITAGSKPVVSNLYLGMVESYYNRMSKSSHITDCDFLIFDECHSTAYFKIIRKNPNQFIMGLTATPVLTGTKDRLNEYYDDIVELSKVEDLIKDGWLCDSRTYSADLIDVKNLDKKNGDFTEESQQKEFGKTRVIDGVLNNFLKFCPDSTFICYNVNVAHSKTMAAFFNFNGIKCRHLDGTTDPEYRKETFAMLKAGDLQGVHNYGICTTGFDEPRVDSIIQNFATISLAKHIQTGGRGARRFDGKKIFHILDMGMNYSRHGLWNVNKDWTDIFHHPKEAKLREEQEALNNLSCSTCGYVMQLKLDACPICDTPIKNIIQKAKADRPPTQAELKLIKAQLTSKLPPHLQHREVKSFSRKELIEYAEHMGYNQKWVYVQLGLTYRMRR
jgi:superfamily II DNA or RNA helicase